MHIIYIGVDDPESLDKSYSWAILLAAIKIQINNKDVIAVSVSLVKEGKNNKNQGTARYVRHQKQNPRVVVLSVVK